VNDTNTGDERRRGVTQCLCLSASCLQVMAVNARGVFLCLKHQIPLLLETAQGQGSITITSSVAGESSHESCMHLMPLQLRHEQGQHCNSYHSCVITQHSPLRSLTQMRERQAAHAGAGVFLGRGGAPMCCAITPGAPGTVPDYTV
jgi:hypothetical protein